MYILEKKKHIEKLFFEVKDLPDEIKVGFPLCKKARRICRKMEMAYLFGEQLKILELSGYDVNYKEKKRTDVNPFYIRSHL